MATSSSSWPKKNKAKVKLTLPICMFVNECNQLLYVEQVFTWGTIGMATFHTCERTVEGIWVLAGDWTGRATSIIPPLA